MKLPTQAEIMPYSFLKNYSLTNTIYQQGVREGEAHFEDMTH